MNLSSPFTYPLVWVFPLYHPALFLKRPSAPGGHTSTQ